MTQVVCRVCTKEFYVKPSHLERGDGVYCSRTCQHKGQYTGKLIACGECGKPTYKNRSTLQRSKSNQFFCGKTCQTVWRNSKVYVGSNHSNWTNGMASYRDRLKRSEIAQVCGKCNSDDVRILAVHHKDRDRTNNELTNLLWLCYNCHYLVHHYKDEAEGFLVIKPKLPPLSL